MASTESTSTSSVPGEIIVGFDGSDGSAAALRWALDEARLRKAPVRVVYAYSYQYAYGVETTLIFADPEELQKDSENYVDAALAKAVPDASVRATIERTIIPGSPSTAILDASANALMTVVGARGHGGFVGLLLGSVATQVVNHTTRPCVVVPKS